MAFKTTPMTGALMFPSRDSPFSIISWVILPARATMRVASRALLKIRLSLTVKIGGESNTIRSNCFSHSSTNLRNRSDPSSSEGLGGVGPDLSTSRFSTDSTGLMLTSGPPAR